MKALLRTTPNAALAWAAMLTISMATPLAAHADDGIGMRRVPALPQYQQECASCHIAYAPGLLPAASWQRLMAGLPKHFGTDASLDAPTTQRISSWLAANAGTGQRARDTPRDDRITLATWFVRKHDEVPPSTWKRPAVKSPSNCSACHAQADQGDFNEDRVRIPR